MSEFLLGYTAGIGSAIVAALILSFAVVGTRERARKPESEPEQQDDIRLTKVKSDYVRVYRHD